MTQLENELIGDILYIADFLYQEKIESTDKRILAILQKAHDYKEAALLEFMHTGQNQ